MNIFFYTYIFLSVLFLTTNTYAQNQIVADLSQENVKIGFAIFPGSQRMLGTSWSI